MIQNESFENFQSLEEIFQIIQNYHRLEFGHLLNKILKEKGVSIPQLFKKLQSQDYYLSLESLYRYFSSSPRSNRFPPQEFIVAYSEALQLTDEQKELLCQFWKYFKLIKKCNFYH